MQILSGYGIFNVYRKTINKEVHSKCWDCDIEGDDAEHALFHCPRWMSDRTVLENYFGMQLTSDNLIEAVSSKEENWVRLQGLYKKIMKARQVQKRNFEEKRRPT